MKKNLLAKIKPLKLGALLSLVLIYVTIFTGWYWLWGVLLLLWASFDLITDQCWLTETIEKRRNPVLYYLIVTTWLTFGFYFLLSPVAYLLR